MRVATLSLSVIVCGAAVMIFELVGSRVLAPYVGTSLFVWTSLIGVILGSLSLGYYLGGIVADKKPTRGALSGIIFLSAICILITTAVKGVLLIFLQTHISDIRLSSVIASLVLFSPASILLGMVSPYAAKLALQTLDKSGSTVGNLYALSTAGSIAGTFLSGFYLIPHVGTNKLLIIISIALFLVSCLLSFGHRRGLKVIGLCIALSSFVIADVWGTMMRSRGFIDTDTAYNRIWIYDGIDEESHEPIRTFSMGNERNSAMFLRKDGLVYEYTKQYHRASELYPGFKKALMLGGAGYSYPKDFLRIYPDATIDVIEIDPGVTALAKKYFKLLENSRLHIIHADAREFLNTTRQTYDVIFGDAFTSHYSLPYQLTTREAVQREYDILHPYGVAIVNIISALEGERSLFLQAEYATYKDIFPEVYLFPVQTRDDTSEVQNIMLIAFKTKREHPYIEEYLLEAWEKEIQKDVPILTDDFAPVDFYINKLF